LVLAAACLIYRSVQFSAVQCSSVQFSAACVGGEREREREREERERERERGRELSRWLQQLLRVRVRVRVTCSLPSDGNTEPYCHWLLGGHG
jgi:hypothetical protein